MINICHKKLLTQPNKIPEKLNLQKLSKLFKFFLSKDFGFYIVKITFLDYHAKIISLIQVFGDLTRRTLLGCVRGFL